MVKRSRDQSHEAPRRLSWLAMVPPLSAFHAHTFSMNFVAAELVAVGLLPLHQLALDHHLRGDAGVVGARLPQHVLAAHALEAAQHVLQRVVERVPHVQRARHVGRRDDDASRSSALARSGRPALKASAFIHRAWMRASISAGW